MNLLIASVDALPQIGGISLMGHHLANAFSAQGHRVIFVGPAGAYAPQGYDKKYYLYEDFASQVRQREGRDGLVQDERIANLGARLIEHYQIDRVLLLHPFYYAVGLMDAAARAGIPISLYFHGFELRSQLRAQYPCDQQELIDERRVGTLRERIFYSIGGADEILVNSRYTASLVEPFAVRPEIRVTGCGIPQELLQREREISVEYDPEERRARRLELGMSPLLTLGFVGRLVKAKRADRVIELCRHAAGLAAVIMGDGPEMAALERRIAQLGLEGRVQLLGSVDELKKWEVLRAVDAFCLLSEPDEKGGQVEGFGIALLEGAAAGALPVSSGTGGMTDVVKDGETGVVLSSEDKKAAVVLDELLCRPERVAELVSNARQQLDERFNWEAVARLQIESWNRQCRA